MEDADNDGLPDYWEENYFEDLTHTGASDSDGDGLTDAQEFFHGTNPTLFDTEEDGVSDGLEIERGTHPLWEDSFLGIDLDDEIGLTDAILVLKIVAGIEVQDIHENADISGDDKTGLEEAIYILQTVAEMR